VAQFVLAPHSASAIWLQLMAKLELFGLLRKTRSGVRLFAADLEQLLASQY
jgi:hypothetical protein